MKFGRHNREPEETDPPRGERRRLVVPRPRPEARTRAKGEGWRSVIAGAITTAALGGLAYVVEVDKLTAVAPWITLALLGVLAGKDIGRVADAIVAAVTALRSR